jgi:hypothetical protein
MTSVSKRVWLKDQKRRASGRSSAPLLPAAVDYDRADEGWSCHRKKAYPTEAFARRVAQKMRDERDANVVAYGCRHCGSYHIGRAPA